MNRHLLMGCILLLAGCAELYRWPDRMNQRPAKQNYEPAAEGYYVVKPSASTFNSSTFHPSEPGSPGWAYSGARLVGVAK